MRPEAVESSLHQFATEVVPRLKDAGRDQAS